MCIPYLNKTKIEHEHKKTIALDPGVKTFCTGYDSSNGDCINFNNRLELLKRLKNKIRLMMSRNVAKEKIQKWYTKISNIITDTHWRFVTYLTRNYDEIILPHFESQKMIKKDCHGFNQILIDLNRHYQFKEKLKWKCSLLNKKLIMTNESFTTKTCGLCGKINDQMTLGTRVFNCVDENCQMKNIDRDYHAARNIYLKTKFC